MDSTTWKPQPSDYLDALVHQNPWHGLGNVPEALARPTKRHLAQCLWQVLVESPLRFQLVLGPRRVGKTVALYQTAQQIIDSGVSPKRVWFMRMDHPLLHHYPLGSWAKALVRRENATAESPLYLLLDELNYAKNWDLWLKTFYDEQWPIRIAATSSSVAALRDRQVESGIGRWTEQFLTPYNFDEYLRLHNQDLSMPAVTSLHATLRAAVQRETPLPNLAASRTLYAVVGGFPELLLQHDGLPLEEALLRSQQTLRSEAVQRVTGMDLPQTFQIREPIILERLLYLLAGQMCGQMGVSNLATTLEITKATVLQYISYLERAFLIFTLPPYAGSEEAIQRRGRKVYFVDGAVRNAALDRGLACISDTAERGFLIENLAASHLYGLSLQTGSRLFHWREKKLEVDFVYDDPAEPVGVEVTSSARHTLKGIKAFYAKHPRFVGKCFLVSSESSIRRLPEDDPDQIGRLPLDDFLLAVSTQTSRALSIRLGVS
ncbi:MAG: ATP-binding protein [Phycisphaerales bacterium]|nr:ATP-binding protein [Phycisphaerales bacterium]